MKYPSLVTRLLQKLPSPRGSRGWLIRREEYYSGIVRGIGRRKVSPLDDRSASELAAGGMHGGDRMGFHGYADIYARCLAPLTSRPFKATHPFYG